VLVFTPNLCFDVTIDLPELVPGSVSRATATVTSAGGKGVNVVRAAGALTAAEQVRLAGFLADGDGARLASFLSDEGTAFHPVHVDGAVRVASILLEQSGRVTVINGRGPDISADRWAAMVELIDDIVGPGELIVCSGSLPPGVPADGYAQIVALGHRKGSQVVVDAAPEPLAACLSEQPDLVSPNLSEAEAMLFGRTSELVHEEGADVPDRAVVAARALHVAGARRAVVTAGAAGAALCTADGTWWLVAAPVTVLNPIGAGDAFVGGASVALTEGATDLEVVRAGIASGSASCEQKVAGRVDAGRVADLRAAGISIAIGPDATIATSRAQTAAAGATR